MKVLKSEIDWQHNFSNIPRVKVWVDRIPDLDEMEFIQRGNLYYAELDGFVQFFCYDSPDNGFGGSHFKLHMKDGSTKILKGPWSSGTYAMNDAGFGPCAEASISIKLNSDSWFISGAITLDLLQVAVKQNNCFAVKHLSTYAPSLHPHRLVAWKMCDGKLQKVMYSNVSPGGYIPFENSVAFQWERSKRRIFGV